ncbi:MAG: hypothetical protein WC508_01980 [Patescibacteria group bacterium]
METKGPREISIARFIRQLCGRKGPDGKPLREVVIEAGHIYADEHPGKEHIESLKLAAELSERLTRARINPVQLMLIDDYSSTETKLCQKNYLSRARGLGFDPVEIIMESSLVTGAEQVIEKLTEAKLIGHSDGIVMTASPKIHLKKPDGKFSCVALDAAFYRYRFRHWPFSVTILPGDSPRRYQDQQKHTRQILRMLGHETKNLMANGWFRENGIVNFVFPDR